VTILDRLYALRAPKARPASYKAVTDVGPWINLPLSSLRDTPQKKAEAFLRAYKVGWFHKAGRRIADDFSNLEWQVTDGDIDSTDPDEQVLDRPDLDVPFDGLDPIGQFMRLMERPNPNQTGRVLRQKTRIRLDFAGTAFWYLENGDSPSSLPTAIYGISPSRMWPSYSDAGQLIGWVMDADKPDGGVPFGVDEILPFSMGGPDDDPFGVGVVEAVYAEVPLTELMAKHTATVMTTGGRLAGMIWPKDRALSEDEFTDVQRAWRNVTSDPQAGKRLLVFPEPMEYAAGASTPAEIGIPELAVLNRDVILTAFPISPYQLGVPMPGGLNSAETRREDRRDYWQGTIEPRTLAYDETVKVGLLERYERVMGRTFNFRTPIPNLDDAPTLVGKTEAYKGLVAVGFDPQAALTAVGLEHIKWNGLPDLLDPAKQAMMAEQAMEAEEPPAPPPPPAKTIKGQREDARERGARTGTNILDDFFQGQRERTESRIREVFPAGKRQKALPGGWWDGDTEDELLEKAMRALYLQVGKSSLQIVADQLDRTVLPRNVKRILEDLAQNGASRVVGINERTRDAIALELTEGVRRGYSVNQLIDGVPDENYKGLTGAALDNQVPVWSDARAETIARTETALSMNRAALIGYDEFGVKTVEAIDGDEDPECAERHGQSFDIETALGIEDHPNGTLDWIPVVPTA
jgi:hypothetical protein